MSKVHSQNSRISTADAGPNMQIRLSALLGLMQDAASRHASILGVGYEQLAPIHRTFVLSRLELVIEQPLPVWGQEIRLETWPRKLDRMLAYRDFKITISGCSSPFLKATSAWLLVDTQLRKPARPHEALLNIEKHSENVIHESSPERIQARDDLEVVGIRHAYPSDLDPNRHVNNTRYFDWITDAVYAWKQSDVNVQQLSIHFIREIQLGEEVLISIKQTGANEFQVQGSGNGNPRFAARLLTASIPSMK